MRAFRRDGLQVYPLRVTLSVVLITYNEQANLARTLESVKALVRLFLVLGIFIALFGDFG